MTIPFPAVASIELADMPASYYNGTLLRPKVVLHDATGGVRTANGSARSPHVA